MLSLSSAGIRNQHPLIVEALPAGLFSQKEDGWALVQAVAMGINAKIIGEPGGQFEVIEHWLRSTFRQVEAEDRLLFDNQAHNGLNAESSRLLGELWAWNKKKFRRDGLKSMITLCDGRSNNNTPSAWVSEPTIYLRLPPAADASNQVAVILNVQSEQEIIQPEEITRYRELVGSVSYNDEAENVMKACIEFDSYRAKQDAMVSQAATPRRMAQPALPTSAWIRASRWLKGAATMEGRHQVDATDFPKLAYALRPGFFEVSPELKAAMVQESWYPRVASYLKS
jgi:hypothetical protein